MKNKIGIAVAVCALFAVSTQAEMVDVIGGQTNVLLDTDLLSSAASLELSSVSGDVIVPGNLGPDSVAFSINARDAAVRPTTFSYDTTDFLGTFGGTIEHEGSVRFNSDTIDVGDFTIGFDAARAGGLGGLASGFFVQDNVSLGAILFDVENPSSLSATDTELVIGANLLVSPEFGQFLFDNGLSATNLQGADVGDALVEGIVPEPASFALLGLAAAMMRRRR
jgi:hypothetical protein